MIEGAIYNDQGQVAMRYGYETRVVVTCKRPDGADKSYIFVTRNGVAMSWVDEQDVPCCHALKGGCCGGTQRPGIIHLANYLDVRYWTGLMR